MLCVFVAARTKQRGERSADEVALQINAERRVAKGYWQVRGAYFEAPEVQFQPTTPAVVAVDAVIEGVRVKVNAPADALPVAVMTQFAVKPDAATNLLNPGLRMLPQALVGFMLFDTIASDAACRGPEVAIKTSVARERIR
jgi:hypothetical protein